MALGRQWSLCSSCCSQRRVPLQRRCELLQAVVRPRSAASFRGSGSRHGEVLVAELVDLGPESSTLNAGVPESLSHVAKVPVLRQRPVEFSGGVATGTPFAWAALTATQVAADAALARDAEALEAALSGGADQVEVSLSRETVEFVSRVVKAKASGQDVIITHGFEEVTPAQAAAILGMSRPQVRRLMDRGALPFRMVGTHHRIRVADLRAFDKAERARQDMAMAEFTALENEFGLVE